MKLDGFAPEDDADEPLLWPDLPIIDAHHHLWPTGARIAYDAAAFADDLGSGHKIIATVFVECMAAYRSAGEAVLRPVGETDFIVADCPADIMATPPLIGAGIIAWADLRDPAAAFRCIAAHVEAGQGRVKGIRHNAVWHERAELVGARTFPRHLLMEARFRESLAEIARLGLTYDVWVFHEQLPEVAAVADALPSLRIVLNHIGGPVTLDSSPEGRRAIFDRWRNGMAELARRPNVHVKFGGLGMTAYAFGFADRPRRPGSSELAREWQPCFDVVIGAFGAERVMFESNFPVDKQSFSYRALWNAFKRLSAGCSDAEVGRLFAGTANDIYRLGL